ncbi:asparaginase [Aestuariivita boseongensis]|uniref:asparaginase n=1 Tax=Aestuariivita boseongensis TaxID=1470562 RepID=UPI0006803BD7|nr:asparaginase [Aestuariivita boseongensis]
MSQAVPMVEVWRGDLLESLHSGHAVICDDTGQIVEAWGNPHQLIYPRSSCKMVQALPLLESGAADRAGLTSEHLALACASHNGNAIHTDRVQRWLADLGMNDDALRCGTQWPQPQEAEHAMVRAGQTPCQYHNNCSGKHSGFLTLSKDMGAGPEYVDPDHPVQLAVKDAFERATGEDTPGFGIDGCSAPNFQSRLLGLARAMARFASAPDGSAEARLRNAMMQHPDLVAGEGRSCTRLMRAMGTKAAIKTGAEAVFIAILPDQKLGVALKITDGATRASECAITALLVRLGVLSAEDPVARDYLAAPLLNRRGIDTGVIRPSEGFI